MVEGMTDETAPMVSPSVRSLMALYTASCAPLSGSTLIEDLPDLAPEDFAVGTAVEEIAFVKNLAQTSLSTAVDFFENATLPESGREHARDVDSPLLPPKAKRVDEQTEIDRSVADAEVVAALLATANVAKRLSSVLSNLNQFCLNAADRVTADPSQVVRELEAAARQGIRAEGPVSQDLGAVFDLTPNIKWTAIEVPLRNRVGFKETAAVISEDKVEEEALKETQVRRRKQRNPTGYHKFNFKDLGLDESSDFESEGRGRGGVGTGASTDEGSTRGSIGTGPTALAPPPTGKAVPLSSRSVSSNEDQQSMTSGSFHLTERSSSTVVFSGEKEREIIEDAVADPEWEAQQRHARRFSRIRNRIPTGHPSLMRNSSDELTSKLLNMERTISHAALDDTTADNTEANKVIPTIALPSSGDTTSDEDVRRRRQSSDESRKTVTMASGF